MIDIGKVNGAIRTLNALSVKVVKSTTISMYRSVVMEAGQIYQSLRNDVERGGCPGNSGEGFKEALHHFQQEADKTFDHLRT